MNILQAQNKNEELTTPEETKMTSASDNAVGKSSPLYATAEDLGAVYMLPPAELDAPLSPLEIEPRYGEPFITDGIDYTAAARMYLLAVHGQPLPNTASKASKEPLPSLRQLAASEKKVLMETSIRLLLDHDSKAHIKEGLDNFDTYVHRESGQKVAHSTIWRRIVHGRFALLAAAAGFSGNLPSQAQSYQIGQLPRNHWIRFWKNIVSLHPTGNIGEDSLTRAVNEYVVLFNMPLRGGLLRTPEKALENSPLALPPSPSPEPPAIKEENDKSKTNLAPLSKADALKQTLLVLDKALEDYFPASTLKKLKKSNTSPARQYLTSIRAARRNCPSPAKLAKRLRLFDAIQECPYGLGEEVVDLMFPVVFETIDRNLQKGGIDKKLPQTKK